MYDVYRYKDLVARVRIRENGNIEWAYGQEQGDWQGFWWSNEVKFAIEHIIREYPKLDEFPISDFVIRLRRTDTISL